jgi:phosphatidyl-myo-inositol alpha-mannosyltransferase
MKVLLACPYAWDVPGGVQTHVRQLAATLRDRGHDVAVAAPFRSNVIPEPEVERVGRAVSLPWGGSIVPLCASAASFRRIRALLQRFDPDVVHAHEPFSPSTAMLATLVARRPVVATFHAFIDKSRVLEASAPLLRIVWRRIAAAVAVSEAAAECAGRVVRRPIDVVPNGVASPAVARRSGHMHDLPRGRLVLWTHRLEPRKGFPIAIRAFAKLAADLDDVHLVVVGDGPDRAALELLPDRHRGRVSMLGPVSDDALASLRAEAGVFVAPAVGQESFGIALVEAMAAGLPVVASDITGYREVVRHGVDGLLVPPNDPIALAAALRRVLTEPGLTASLGGAGRRRARMYSWDVVVPRLEAIYARVAAMPETPAAPVSAA